jgi:hypothetical protein
VSFERKDESVQNTIALILFAWLVWAGVHAPRPSVGDEKPGYGGEGRGPVYTQQDVDQWDADQK